MRTYRIVVFCDRHAVIRDVQPNVEGLDSIQVDSEVRRKDTNGVEFDAFSVAMRRVTLLGDRYRVDEVL